MAKYLGLDGLEESSFELIFEQDGQRFDGVVPVSNPPSGSYRVCNLFVTPQGRLVVQYSDEPAR